MSTTAAQPCGDCQRLRLRIARLEDLLATADARVWRLEQENRTLTAQIEQERLFRRGLVP